MIFNRKSEIFPPKAKPLSKTILSRIQFSTEKRDRLFLNNHNDSHHCQCVTDGAMKQENSLFSNRTKRIGGIAPDTTLISVLDLAAAVFPAREPQLTWSTAGCFSTPSHLLLSLRKLSRGKPPHTAPGWILIPVSWICIRKQQRTDRRRLICFRSYCQKKIKWSRKSHFFQLLCSVCSRENYPKQIHKSRYISPWYIETDLQQRRWRWGRRRKHFFSMHVLV